MKNLIKYIPVIGIILMGYVMTSCSDVDDIVDPQYDRLFSPIDLEARIQNKTSVRLTWSGRSEDSYYIVELVPGTDEEGEASGTYTVASNEIPYTIDYLEGETKYIAKIKAVSEDPAIEDSKWSTISFETDTEQIFEALDIENDLEATQVTLRWPAGVTATSITLTTADATGNITYTITADDIAAGAATITGLTGETTYTATLLNGTKVRGTLTFETPVDIGNATLVEEGDDLAEKLATATEGEVFAIMPGEYELGEFDLTVSIALKGAKPANKPIIKGSFKINATVASLELNSIIMNGEGSINYPFNTNNGNCNIGAITVANSELNNYGRGLFYINTGTAKIGDVKFMNSIVSYINPDGTSGGDGVDIRSGELRSFIVENCTFNTGFRAFTRIQVNTDMAFRNCTFYSLCTVDSKDNSGLFRISGGTLEVSKCLFVATGVEDPTEPSSGNWSKAGNVSATTSYSDNYYYDCHNLWVGQYTDPASCGATLSNDPGFEDAANGDFTLSDEDLIYYGIGDSRWR